MCDKSDLTKSVPLTTIPSPHYNFSGLQQLSMLGYHRHNLYSNENRRTGNQLPSVHVHCPAHALSSGFDQLWKSPYVPPAVDGLFNIWRPASRLSSTRPVSFTRSSPAVTIKQSLRVHCLTSATTVWRPYHFHHFLQSRSMELCLGEKFSIKPADCDILPGSGNHVLLGLSDGPLTTTFSAPYYWNWTSLHQ